MGSDVASRRPSIIGDIPGHWERMTLGEAAARVGGDVQTGPFGSQLHASDYVPVGIPSIMPVNIGDNVIVDKGIARITEEDAKRLAKYRVAADDIIYSRRGDVERRALVTKKESGWLCGTGCLRVRLGAGLNSKFMSYQLGHPAVREWIVRHAVGATMPNLNTKILSSVPVVIPPLAVQRRIAAILGSLDDKIEANRKMAKTLEAIASAVFKSWFVDFDPIRAKIAGATSWPSMPQAAFDALPAAFVETEIGEVPEGWGPVALPDMVSINPRRQLAKGVLASYVAMADMPTDGHVPSRITKRSFGSGARFSNGDTLLARITPCLENGKTAYVDFLNAGEVGWGSTEYIVLCPKLSIPSEFIYCLARSARFRDYAIQSMAGTSGRQRVQTNALEQYLLANPSEVILGAFGELVYPFFDHVSHSAAESRSLAAVRDTLLPTLISGELRVDEAEEEMEAFA